MPRLDEMDARVPLRAQMQQEVGPVILINTFAVEPDDVDRLQQAWAVDAAFMKRQPGFISTQLHRGIGGSSVLVNYAVWESVEDFSRAFSHPEFQSKLANYPASTVASPHLFQKVPVPRICIA
jgi:heme-degrading monooxygenase HmoA